MGKKEKLTQYLQKYNINTEIKLKARLKYLLKEIERLKKEKKKLKGKDRRFVKGTPFYKIVVAIDHMQAEYDYTKDFKHDAGILKDVRDQLDRIFDFIERTKSTSAKFQSWYNKNIKGQTDAIRIAEQIKQAMRKGIYVGGEENEDIIDDILDKLQTLEKANKLAGDYEGKYQDTDEELELKF